MKRRGSPALPDRRDDKIQRRTGRGLLNVLCLHFVLETRAISPSPSLDPLRLIFPDGHTVDRQRIPIQIDIARFAVEGGRRTVAVQGPGGIAVQTRPFTRTAFSPSAAETQAMPSLLSVTVSASGFSSCSPILPDPFNLPLPAKCPQAACGRRLRLLQEARLWRRAPPGRQNAGGKKAARASLTGVCPKTGPRKERQSRPPTAGMIPGV